MVPRHSTPASLILSPPGPDPSPDPSPQRLAQPPELRSRRQQHHQCPQSSRPQQQTQALPVGRFTEEWDASQRGSSIIGSPTTLEPAARATIMQRSNSVHSYSVGDDSLLPVRNNTLKKKASTRRASSLRRSSSRRSNYAGSVRSLGLHSAYGKDNTSSAFYCPVPTLGTPTDTLAGRFQTWRKLLKDLITYFRETQSHYEHRSKSIVKLANVANNIVSPASFLKSAGIDDALQFLREYHTTAIQETKKAKEIEEDVILALTGLRSDLQQKIKEIKNLAGDFKNSFDREMENTHKAVRTLAQVLEKSEVDSASTTGKQDPYLLRLAVDRQVERQVDEENYLYQAYLNLEGSGRELESIVVGEIQKAYNAYAGILKREVDNASSVVEELRDGPIAMPKDQEWIHFVTHDDQIVDPMIPLRLPQQIHYPGQDHLAAQEIRTGLLERKSKYLKSYTPGWYVLSTTHLHEFKSVDKAQAPVMSLYLPEQKLGSHSTEGGSSNKFILKGRQTGTMHRGHTWVFRAESHDTMIAWYEDIKALMEKTAEERNQFVRTYSRSLSQSSRRSASSDGIIDEDDDEPFSAKQIDVAPEPRTEPASRRPKPGGRFPSDLQVNAQRGLQAAQSPSSVSSGHVGFPPNAQDATATTGTVPNTVYTTGSEGHHDGNQWQDSRMSDGTDEILTSNMSSYTAVTSQDEHCDKVISEAASRPIQQYYAAGQDPGYFGATPAAMPQVAHHRHPELDTEAMERGSELGNASNAASGPMTNDQRQVIDVAAVAPEERRSNSALPAPTTSGSVNGTSAEEKEQATERMAGNNPVIEALHERTLQSVPEAWKVDHSTSGVTAGAAAPGRPSDARTNSAATLSNLSIPGKFPKASGIVTP